MLSAHDYQDDEEKDSRDYAYSRLTDGPSLSISPKNSQADILREKAKEGIVELPLPKDLAHLLSSDDYAELLCSALGPADVLFTWGPRYSGVFDTILSGSSSMGPFIEATSQNFALAVLVYLAIGAASAVNFYLQYQGKKAAHQDKCDTYRKVRRRFKLEPETENDEVDMEEEKVDAATYNANLNRLVTEMNEALQIIIGNNASLTTNKYESIKISCPPASSNERIQLNDLKIECTFKKKALTPKEVAQKKKPEFVDEAEKPGIFRKFVNKVLSPLYTTVSLSSYVYWIFWIGASIAVGNFADAGIAGVSAWLGFGVPLAAAIPYTAIKIRNWSKNKGHVSDEHARLTKIADNDTPQLLMEALRQTELNAEINRIKEANEQLRQELPAMSLEYKTQDSLVNTIEGVPNDDSFLANPKTKAAAQLYTSIVSNYGMSQFNAWLVSDFLKVSTTIAFAIPFFGQIIGGALIGLGVGLGAYETYKKYKENVKEQSLAPKGPAINLMETFEAKKAELERLTHSREAKLLALDPYLKETKEAPLKLSKILERPSPSKPSSMSLPRKIYNFFDWQATGIFFARIFFTAGAAVFLPFAAAALTNPVTIGILALSGAIFLGLKVYQAYQKQKEAHAKELVSKIQDMDEQIHIARMTEKTLDMKKQILEAKVGHALQPARKMEIPSKASSKPIAIPSRSSTYRSQGLFSSGKGKKDSLTEPLLSGPQPVEDTDQNSPVFA